MIEHRCSTPPRQQPALRLHPSPRAGHVTEGLLALSEDGWLIGATRPRWRPAGLAMPSARRAGRAGHRRPGHARAVERARRVVDKPIALLLQGESGVGKEVFARAVHASGRARTRPSWR
jgi:transcriptional regulator of acetoin/glycerol metabolism